MREKAGNVRGKGVMVIQSVAGQRSRLARAVKKSPAFEAVYLPALNSAAKAAPWETADPENAEPALLDDRTGSLDLRFP